MIPFTLLICLSVISLISMGVFLHQNSDKINKKINSIDKSKLSQSFDRLSNLNGTLTFLFFLINVVVTMHYTFVYNGLVDAGNTTDISIILIPMLGLITAFLVCVFHNYSTNVKSISDLLGMILTVFCITLLFVLIPVIGFKFDVLGISADYWKFTSTMIYHILIYLSLFMVANFIIKANVETAKNNG